MTATTDNADAKPDAAATFDGAPVVASVDLDRFCDGCGYNLRTAGVRLDPRTQLLLVRCPECGRFSPANDATTAGRLWLKRASTLLLCLWIIVILHLAAAIVMTHVMAPVAVIEVLDRRAYFLGQNNEHAMPHFQERLIWAQVVHYSLQGSCGLLAGFLAVVVFPHWKRIIYGAVLAAWPALTMFIFWRFVAYMEGGRHMGMADELAPYLAKGALLTIAAGLLMVWLGRPLARGMVRVFLPPRIRGPMAYLWTADGKQPPLSSGNR